MKSYKAALAIGFLSVLTFVQARATVIVTYAEQPGIESSTFINATTETFDSLSTGVHSNVVWDGVGTFDKLNILKADQYGGAGNSNYAVEGLGSVSQTILNLNSPSGYFGMWWSAGEPFAFINFFATPNTSWSSVVFRNSSNSGFEGDNYASRVAVYNPTVDGAMPGIVLEAINGTQEVSLIPEPNATFAMLLMGSLSAGGSLVRRFKKKG